MKSPASPPVLRQLWHAGAFAAVTPRATGTEIMARLTGPSKMVIELEHMEVS